MSALASEVRGLPIDTIAQRIQLTPQTTQEALYALKQHDIVRFQDGRWSFTASLMRHWVLQKGSRNSAAR